jgi:LmbE family N-acetylglucosaminyl deacetylase
VSHLPAVTVVSPHFDDVPLSLGQSLRDGALSRCDVRVRVVFGRTNWTNWMHPTAGRATAVGWWRRLEESVAAVSFGYRWTAAGWDEALLRWGTMDDERLLDPTADLTDEPLVGQIAGWLQRVVDAEHDRPGLLLVPAGLGGHVDHRIVAAAAVAARARLTIPVGFYEDRPYVAHLDEPAVAEQLGGLGIPLEAVPVSGPVTAATQRRVRRAYPSQIDEYFVAAMERDRGAGAVERVWFPVGTAPAWLR